MYYTGRAGQLYTRSREKIVDNVRLLYIEDNPHQREDLAAQLGERGFAVVTAADGREGLERFAHESFDLVLCDLNMEPIDGLAVLHAVKEARPQVPVVILTAHGSVAQAVEAIKDRKSVV